VVTVTTDNGNFFYNKKQLTSPYPEPIPIVKLQENQEIEFSAITRLGKEDLDAVFSAVSIVTYKQISDNEFIFILESRGQLTEKRILQVAIANIINTLNTVHKNAETVTINKKAEKDELIGTMELKGIDATVGNLINRCLQLHPNVSFAGYNINHPLIKTTTIHYKLKKGNIIEILREAITYSIKLFTAINDKLDF
jgi:DNA-directed RNA polymerase subunit L